ncbi:hypothetical protein Hanom_Chr03g00218811 [Helianthus anomalus]
MIRSPYLNISTFVLSDDAKTSTLGGSSRTYIITSQVYYIYGQNEGTTMPFIALRS